MLRFRIILACAIAGVVTPIFGNAATPSYPSRPISIIVPFPAGGVIDTLARILAGPLHASLGQPIIIENVPGAGGSIGVSRAVHARPDGYTISIGDWTSHVGTGAVYPVQYDVLTDLQPISLLTTSPQIIVSRPDLMPENAVDLISWLRAYPNKASAATLGPGSTPHICSLYFQRHTGTSFQFVPYRGAAPAMQDLMGRQVDLMCAEASTTLAHVRSGKLKAYAVLARNRSEMAPNIPTSDEAGIRGLYFSSWRGLWVPHGTSTDIVEKLNAAVMGALADPAVHDRIVEIGHEIVDKDQQTPSSLLTYHKQEIEKWWPIIKAAGVKPD